MLIGVASADHLRADKSQSGKEQWGGAGWARVGQYIPYLQKAGHQVVVGALWGKHGEVQIETAEGQFFRPDLVLMQRLMVEGVPELLQTVKGSGQIIVNDVDDWYWGLDPRNQAFKASHPKHSPKENTNLYRGVLSKSDYIITSTPYLRDRITDMFNGRITVGLNHNYVDVDRFTAVNQNEDYVQIGWAGSTGHRSGDLQILKGVLSRVASDEYVRMHHSGSHPNSPDFSSETGLEKFDVSTSPMTTYKEYPSLLSFDVGLVPLSDTPFNHAKSDIKGLEYAAAGIPFVASDLPSYRSLFDSWKTGMFLAKNPNDWVKHLNRLKDYGLRTELQHSLLENVRSRHIDIGASHLVEILESIR